MNGDEEFFLDTLDDLRDKLKRGTPYAILKGAGILREILVDERPLMHLANKRLRKEILFVFDADSNFLDVSGVPKPDVYWINPASPLHVLQPRKLDAFLNLYIATAENNTITARSLIKACANYLGGIHRSAPTKPEHLAVEALRVQLGAHGIDAIKISAAALVEITLRALQPLELALKSGH